VPLNILREKLRHYLARRLRVPEIPVALERLRKQGFVPDLVFDVGAYRGDFAREILIVWPTAEIACFEPQEHVQPELRRLSGNRVSIFQTLLGSAEKQNVTLYCSETASSVLTEHFNKHPGVSAPQTTIAKIVDAHYNGRSPDLLKVDVQGYELEVLMGGESIINNVKVILLEVNLIDLHENVPLLHTIVDWMRKRDFVTFDVCGMGRRPLDDALWQIDMIFVPMNSELRRDKHWNTK
jgi:FkbM family methyltransferase